MKSKLCKPKYGIKSILTQLNGSGIQIFAWEKAINSNSCWAKEGLLWKESRWCFHGDFVQTKHLPWHILLCWSACFYLWIKGSMYPNVPQVVLIFIYSTLLVRFASSVWHCLLAGYKRLILLRMPENLKYWLERNGLTICQKYVPHIWAIINRYQV